jgi:Protein  of unknown function (DUF3018)
MTTRKIPPGKSRKAPPGGRKSRAPTAFSPSIDDGRKVRRFKKGAEVLRPSEPKRVRFEKAGTSADRVRRHREEMRRKGMRPITLWVPDTRSPEFAAAAAEACRRANEADKTDPAVKYLEDLVEQSFRDLDESGL